MAKEKSAVESAKESFMQLYHTGEFDPGDKIPSETFMSKKLGISRETWRKALSLLRGEGILISRHGSGTYVNARTPKIANDLSQLRSLTQMIADAGIKENKAETVCMIKQGDLSVCDFFGVAQNDPFFVLQKIRHADLGPISASEAYLPQEYAKMLEWSAPPSSLFSYLEKEYNIYIARAFTEIFIPDPNDPLYKLFNLPDNCNALGLRQFHFDQKGNPVIVSTDYLRSDIFNFTIMRNRP